MSKTTANISIDSEVKAKSQALFADLGMDLSTAINIFLRQAIRENGMPFAITREVPNATTFKAMKSSEERTDVYGPFDNIDDLMEALDA